MTADGPARHHARCTIVVPVHNEAETLPELYRRVSSVTGVNEQLYELIFVNDGSQDASLEIMKTLHDQDRRVKVIDLSRNFGHQVAVSAGLDHAHGDVVIVMDADLQDPPELLQAFLAKWREGFDVIYGIRRRRKEGVLKRLLSVGFYRIFRKISAVNMPLDAGAFSLIDARVVDLLRSMPERTRFIPGLRSWVGFRQTGIEYDRPPRHAGTAVRMTRLFRLAIDGLTSFSYLPLQMASYAGFTIAGLSFLAAVYYLYGRLTTNKPVLGFATIVILILFLGGVQLITLGIIGEYIGRIFDEVKHRPLYVVRDRIGFAE